jgi:hypothetical protein
MLKSQPRTTGPLRALAAALLALAAHRLWHAQRGTARRLPRLPGLPGVRTRRDGRTGQAGHSRLQASAAGTLERPAGVERRRSARRPAGVSAILPGACQAPAMASVASCLRAGASAERAIGGGHPQALRGPLPAVAADQPGRQQRRPGDRLLRTPVARFANPRQALRRSRSRRPARSAEHRPRRRPARAQEPATARPPAGQQGRPPTTRGRKSRGAT